MKEGLTMTRDEARNSVPPDARPVFDRLVEEYRFHATVVHGRPFVSYGVLAALVRDGWRPTDGPHELVPEADDVTDAATPIHVGDASEGDVWYFAYGSNLWREQKKRRTGAIREARVARLTGYRLAFNKRGSEPGQVYANIVPEPEAEVYGVIYRCSPEALHRMDRWEVGYRRHPVEAVTRSGETVEAVAYVAEPEWVCDEQAPNPDYLERILRGAREHGLPEEYVRWIEALGAEEMSVEEEFAVLASAAVGLFNAAPWQTDTRAAHATGLLIKLYDHVSCAFYIAPGILSPRSTGRQYDFASVFVLCRAAFETFLRFHHIFVKPTSQEERDCRYYGWVLSSLLRKQKYPATLAESKQILADDKRAIDELEERLADNSCYQSLTKKERSSLRRDGKLHGWSKMADDAGQDEWTAKHSYDYMCGHAHSGAASVVQISQAGPGESEEDDQHRARNVPDFYGLHVGCVHEGVPSGPRGVERSATPACRAMEVLRGEAGASRG